MSGHQQYTDPYEVFTAARLDVHVALPMGGVAPIDPRSGSADPFKRLPSARAAINATRPLSSPKAEDFVGMMLAGGHGTMWDFADKADLRLSVEALMARNAAVGAVVHGPAGLLSARQPDGAQWIGGRRVNGITNAGEAAAGMSSVVPFMLEDRLRTAGGKFESSRVCARHVGVEGALITGQNPAPTTGVAEAMVRHLQGNNGSESGRLTALQALTKRNAARQRVALNCPRTQVWRPSADRQPRLPDSGHQAAWVPA